jgi:hypothetical protein
MNKVDFNGKLWQGYGMLVYTDISEKIARNKIGANLNFQIHEQNGLTFITEPVDKLLIVVRISIDESYTTILYKKGDTFCEISIQNEYIKIISIYEII